MSKLKNINGEVFLYGTLGILSFLVVWYLGVTFTTFGTIFPGPLEVFQGMIVGMVEPIGKTTLLGHVAISLGRVMVGYTLSAILGTIVGLIMGASKMGKALLNGVFNMIKPIPGIAWIPLAILWFGTGNTTIYFIIFVGGFSQMVMNTMAGCGWLITAGMQSGNMVNNVMGMVSIGIIGLILASLMRVCERRLCAWKERG